VRTAQSKDLRLLLHLHLLLYLWLQMHFAFLSNNPLSYKIILVAAKNATETGNQK